MENICNVKHFHGTVNYLHLKLLLPQDILMLYITIVKYQNYYYNN